MSREPKPHFRYATRRGCTIDGKRITLGPQKKVAHGNFHELTLPRNLVASETSTLYYLSQVYLERCVQNRKEGTCQNVKKYLRGIIDSMRRRLEIGALKTHHMTKWLGSFECTTMLRSCRVLCGEVQLRIHTNPLPERTARIISSVSTSRCL